MPQGGVVSIRAENVVLGSSENLSLPSGDYVRISIADQGAGIASEVLPKVFDPYFSTKEKGSGLGLAVVKAVATAHGGSIELRSDVGKGSTFTLKLPIVPESVQAA